MATKAQLAISSANKNVIDFSDRYVACQDRKGDTNTFFSYENQSRPPSLVSPREKSSGKADLSEP